MTCAAVSVNKMKPLKSIAVYYLCEPPKNINKRGRALFAPTDNQANDQAVIDLIKKRSDLKTASSIPIN